MTNRPKSVRSLRDLMKRVPGSDEIRKIFLQLAADPNDRAVAITAGALLEHALEVGLLARFEPLEDEDRKQLFEGDAPLSTLSAKIRVGLAMGLYGTATRDDLDCIREIRNAFAHAMHPISFRTEQVAAVCARLQLPVQFPPLEISAKDPEYARTARTLYLLTTTMITMTLSEGKPHDADQPLEKGFDLVRLN